MKQAMRLQGGEVGLEKHTKKTKKMITMKWRGSNTHSKGEWVKIPLLPNRLGKRSRTMVMTIFDQPTRCQALVC